MPRFYLDENVAEHLAAALHTLGYDAVSTNQLGRKGTSDPLQLLFAADIGHALVTHNDSDYRMLHEAWHAWAARWQTTADARHAGIVIIPQAGGLTIPAMAEHVHRLTQDVSTLENRLFAWSRSRGWNEFR